MERTKKIERIEKRIERYREEIRDIRINRLIPMGYRSYCLRHRNAKKDHAMTVAFCIVPWVLAVVIVFGVLK
jgi:hypothetical protein